MYDAPFHRFFYRVNYLVLPINLLATFPEEWQAQWKAIVSEFAASLGSQWPWPEYQVTARDGGRFIKDPTRHGGGYLVFPRLALEAQPHEWQERAIALLERAHEEFGVSGPSYCVTPKGGSDDPWSDYRYGCIEKLLPKKLAVAGPQRNAEGS